VAIELVLRNWCDVCLEAGTNTPGETVSVAVTGVPAFDVETCAEHGAPLAAAVEALRAYGRAPGKTGRPGPVRPSKGGPTVSSAPTGGRRPRAAEAEGGACPECGHVLHNRAAMRSHLRRNHGKSLADVGLAEARFTCPDCGSKFDHGTGYASHLRTHARTEQSA
jgi:predicted RNA-binding Zn-ribbon protein involved in translation (DUF1610 family)